MHTAATCVRRMSDEAFSAAYAEAKQLILEHNDLDGAMHRLRVATPESEANLWLWTDLVAALLFKKGQYDECCRVLASYENRCPGIHPVKSMIRMLSQESAAVVP